MSDDVVERATQAVRDCLRKPGQPAGWTFAEVAADVLACLRAGDEWGGLKVVPVQSTAEMRKAGGTCKPYMAGWPKGEEAAGHVWDAMLAKAGDDE